MTSINLDDLFNTNIESFAKIAERTNMPKDTFDRWIKVKEIQVLEKIADKIDSVVIKMRV